ncbi:P-loop containing nucleoside triphosphate hydrolase protein [Gilbertella persicaria]|uniref:P-loop containing nucleoside triphosphate hydrolase protein n=1 Tax=Gilbertella persicaria TaxID=101096 RepID=UPI00221F325C|nr:P-loop containing nucleoside triphosphate hydrolase protein [Gilbertella persicaria]KAI8069740.1 P-loop containing nucleoside triphosphate hydrolase protein [Gilbertella persicaria]
MSDSSKVFHPFFQPKRPVKETPEPLNTTTLKKNTPAPPLPRFFCQPESSRKLTPVKQPTPRPVFISDIVQQKPTRHAIKTDHEFARLDRSIFGHGHITDKVFEPCALPHPPQVDLKQIINTQTHAFFAMGKQLRQVTPCMERDTTMPTHIPDQATLEMTMDQYFPQWRSYSSCVVLMQSITHQRSSHKQWVDKYRPNDIHGLLGARHNFTYLKDWLHQMKVQPLSAPKSTGSEHKKKKKRKKMNIRHYYEEEDMDIMRHLSLRGQDSDSDDDDFVVKPKRQLKEEHMRSNIVLLVGDHGVGKTAAVYTAAEQMAYEVFEINSGSRRSGKDIVSMVGEMTKSHLVAFGATPPASVASLFVDKPTPVKQTKRKKLNPCLSSKNGSNGTLKGFLRKKEVKPMAIPTTKQSLILLEEVDLLFEEDKGFWTSVIELAQKSKRPIIMTYLDQVPLDNLSLQIVLDIKPPSDTELLPYLWLMCYLEGWRVEPADLVCLMGLLGRDIRRLIQTCELFAGQEMFGKYLGIEQGMNLTDMKLRSIPSKVCVDTFRLARYYQHEETTKEEEEEESLDVVLETLENHCFIDTWLKRQHSDTEETEDAVRMKEIETRTSLLNTLRPVSSTWQQFLLDEDSHWDELWDARLNHMEDYREAIEKILPLPMPNEQYLTMEYIPHIQRMTVSSTVDKPQRSTRSKPTCR